MKKGLCIEVTQGQYDHLYNIMCSQDEIIDYLFKDISRDHLEGFLREVA